MFYGKKRMMNKNRFGTIQWRSKKAFTLIEMLLALSIVSIISLCIYNTFASGVQLNLRSEQHNKIYREANLAFSLIAKELANAASYDFSNSYLGKKDFYGEEDKITFLLATQDGLKAISYYLSAPEEGKIQETLIGNTYSENVSAVVLRNEVEVRENYLIREELPFVQYLTGSEKYVEKEIISKHIKEDGLRFFYGASGNEKERSSKLHTNIPSAISLEIDFMSKSSAKDSLTLRRDIYIPNGWVEVKG